MPKQAIINKRKDIVTQKRFNKSELIRISITKDKDISLTSNEGRGIYFLNTNEALEKLFKKKILEKEFGRRRIKNIADNIIKVKEWVDNGKKE